MPADLNRAMRPGEITCPAGQLVGAASCECAVEEGVINGRHNPDSIIAFCAGDYKMCPTWQLEKERIAANKRTSSYLTEARAEGARAKELKEEHRQERIERAKRLLFSDTEEACRLRARLGIKRQIETKAA